MAAEAASARPREPAKSRGGDKGGAKAPKTRGAALEKRLGEVEEMLALGWGTRRIYAEAAKRWKVASRTVDDYLAEVKARWEEEGKTRRAEARRRQIARLRRLRENAESRGALHVVMSVEALLSKLEGTEYQPADELTGGAADEVEVVDPPEEGEEPGS